MRGALAGRMRRTGTRPEGEPGEERLAPRRLLHEQIEDDGDEKDQAAHDLDRLRRRAGGDQAGLHQIDDDRPEEGADDRRLAAENRRAAYQNGRYGEKKIPLALVAEVVAILQRQHDRGDRRERAHQSEELDLFAIDVDADHARNVVRIADEQEILTETM